MALLAVAEVFGFDVTDVSTKATRCQRRKWCPFRKSACSKGSASDPLGICTFGDGTLAGAVCPSRFLEKDRIFLDVGRIAFGADTKIIVAPEIRILKVAGKGPRRIGKVDFIIGKLDENDEVCDFAALEVQAVYFSGESVKRAFHQFLKTHALPPGSERRLDYRSSAQKRLMPQLNLKVPVFRRWGKKFFVAIDALFFEHLPIAKTVPSLENSEVSWLVYRFSKKGNRYEMGDLDVRHTLWEDVLTALREGTAPTPVEIMKQISDGKASYRKLQT